ncbi:hypothetical protein IWX48DRAFT_601523 [Phyllosticta citricarpa]
MSQAYALHGWLLQLFRGEAVDFVKGVATDASLHQSRMDAVFLCRLNCIFDQYSSRLLSPSHVFNDKSPQSSRRSLVQMALLRFAV